MPPIIELRINGKATRVEADPERTLLSVLRDDLGLTGAKYGCGEGQCGACTVLVDETPIRSCRAKLGNVAGKAIATIEGLEKDGKLHPVQEAFLEFDAMQCGYCTCGMIMGAVAFLQKNQGPSRDEIVRGMQGHICRCGTYPRIIAAVAKAAAQLKGRTP
jgi:aerobic-type carbon monoxide dehydrogenase small subunit (CoxS/CutS family)